MVDHATVGKPVPRQPVDDPRFQRIRSKLIDAILTLAAEKPAEQISVSELTEAAGVSRTTFYKHSNSPPSFLADYLVSALAPRMEPIAHLLDQPGPGYLMQWREIHLALLEHVAANHRVYTHVLPEGGHSVVLAIITSYFDALFEEFVRDFARHVEGPAPSEVWIQMAASQQVHNTIAMVQSWLKTGMADDPDEVVAAYFSLLPPWQVAHISELGRATLRVDPIHGLLSASFGPGGERLDRETGIGPNLRHGRGRIALGTTRSSRDTSVAPKDGKEALVDRTGVSTAAAH